MKNTTLLIMAAGIGSCFGGGIKQLEPVGLHNKIIMDYSILDAIEARFNKIIFVIHKDIEAEFRERIGNRMESICKKQNVEIAYAFQDLNNVPGEVLVYCPHYIQLNYFSQSHQILDREIPAQSWHYRQ